MEKMAQFARFQRIIIIFFLLNCHLKKNHKFQYVAKIWINYFPDVQHFACIINFLEKTPSFNLCWASILILIYQ
jgi:hypothetical protein